MKFFVDTAEIAEIRELDALGLIDLVSGIGMAEKADRSGS